MTPPQKINPTLIYRLSKPRFAFEAGTRVKLLRTYDYGLASDDTAVTGIAHVSVELVDKDDAFFTVPLSDIEVEH